MKGIKAVGDADLPLANRRLPVRGCVLLDGGLAVGLIAVQVIKPTSLLLQHMIVGRVGSVAVLGLR